MTDPKRYPPGWFLRLPQMLKHKQEACKLTFLSRSKTSYAQFGEGIVPESILWYLHITKSLYFYKRGGSGVCVEPDSSRQSSFKRAQPRDLCLTVGVGAEDKEAVPFYVLSEPSLSTFDQESAQRHSQSGSVRIRSTLSVPIYSINTLIEKHFPHCPDFLSVDVEGLDLVILQTMDFARFRPAVICVETLDFYTQAKQSAVADFLTTKGYRVQADTVINTIFVDELAWAARR